MEEICHIIFYYISLEYDIHHLEVTDNIQNSLRKTQINTHKSKDKHTNWKIL